MLGLVKRFAIIFGISLAAVRKPKLSGSTVLVREAFG
jgi:hypothetical protein